MCHFYLMPSGVAQQIDFNMNSRTEMTVVVDGNVV